MRLKWAAVFILTIIFSEMLPASNRQHSTTFFGSFTSSSKLFHHSNDSDPFLKNQFISFDNIFGIGIDHRITFTQKNFSLGLSFEYLTSKAQESHQIIFSEEFTISDGFYAIPIELSVYYSIPLGFKSFNFFMGGGIGLYLGGRLLEINNQKIQTARCSPGAGIHITTGWDYDIFANVSVRNEIKFRDVQFSSQLKNQYTEKSSSLPITIESTDSRMSIDGLQLTLGLVLKW